MDRSAHDVERGQRSGARWHSSIERKAAGKKAILCGMGSRSWRDGDQDGQWTRTATSETRKYNVKHASLDLSATRASSNVKAIPYQRKQYHHISQSVYCDTERSS